MSDLIEALAANIVERKRAGADPYVLFLGAGASISSGCSSMMQIVDDILCSRDRTQFGSWQAEIGQAAAKDARFGEFMEHEITKLKRQRFFEIWGKLDQSTRYSILRLHLWEGKSPSDGYLDLANSIKEGYFEIALSTNLDNLLEQALNRIGWYQPQNFIVVVNRKDNPEEVRDQLEHARAPFRLVKLHGTLESPRSYAFTPTEVFDFEKSIKPALIRIVSQSLLVVGHSMQDRDIDMLFEEEGKEIHFVNPRPPEPESRIDSIVKVRRQGSLITGGGGKFDPFFQKLRATIGEQTRGADRTGAERSIEGFLRCIGMEHELTVAQSRFRHLPTLYVKPSEYGEICDRLEDQHTVFIVGEPHLGKTYTALHLLWDYYQKGYEPVHVRHDRLVYLLHQHDGDVKKVALHFFRSEDNGPRIVHLDDPFGETMERHTDALVKDLDRFLSLASDFEHLRVVVTTRLSIFREALGEVHSHERVEELEHDLRVHTSYRPDVLRDIFQRYCSFYRPGWTSNKETVEKLNEQLPALLPAPHNIEFFVRTSETLNSMEELLNHIDNCREMIKALAGWIGYLPDHEQVFLMWVEICSTATLLFPAQSAAKMDLESAYMETLAYMFKKGYITGIPPMPFSRSRDKFEIILVERQDGDERTAFDFVHPSYHEAFWYAVQHKFSLHRWWELLKEECHEILKDLGDRIDLVQLRMIERYGTVNRDLDQLLLLSAKSEDKREQLIAFERMLERADEFVHLPEFVTCANSLASSGNAGDKLDFLSAVDKHFVHIPVKVLELVPLLTFDEHKKVQHGAQEFIHGWFDKLPESIRESKQIRELRLLLEIFGLDLDELTSLDEVVERSFFGLRQLELDKVIEQSLLALERLGAELGIQREYRFTLRQLSMKRIGIQFHLVQLLRGAKPERSLEEALARITELSLAELELLMNSRSKFVQYILVTKMLESYDELSPEQRELFVSQRSMKTDQILNSYVESERYDFQSLSENALAALVRFQVGGEYVAYEVLAALLLKYHTLSKQTQRFVLELIDNPPGWWVGGGVGQVTSEDRAKRLCEEAKQFPIKLSRHGDKRVVGALLAKLGQNEYSKRVNLLEVYKPTLDKLCKDPEVMRHAEAWMDHELQVFGFHDEDYWAKVKAYLQDLAGGHRSVLNQIEDEE